MTKNRAYRILRRRIGKDLSLSPPTNDTLAELSILKKRICKVKLILQSFKDESEKYDGLKILITARKSSVTSLKLKPNYSNSIQIDYSSNRIYENLIYEEYTANHSHLLDDMLETCEYIEQATDFKIEKLKENVNLFVLKQLRFK